MDRKNPSLRDRRTSLRLDGREEEQDWPEPTASTGVPTFSSHYSMSTGETTRDNQQEYDSNLPTPEESLSKLDEDGDVFTSFDQSYAQSSPRPARRHARHRLSDYGPTRDLPSLQTLQPERRRISQQSPSVSSVEYGEDRLLQSLGSQGRVADNQLVKFYIDMRRQGKVRNIPKEVESIIIRGQFLSDGGITF